MKRTYRLSRLLKGFAEVLPDQDSTIAGLAIDSRHIEPDELFLAMPGVTLDGRQFIDDAVARGAAAIVFESSDGFKPGVITVPAYPVADLHSFSGKIADRFYDSPSQKLTVIGVTGTNGKTTCTQLLAQALDQETRRCGIIGTLGNGFPDALDSSIHTTPDTVTVHALLAEYLSAGAAYVCIEVSSHALDQGRVSGVEFDIAVFTNLTRDHLDYHGDMESYARSKSSLFTLPDLRVAIINCEDEFGCDLLTKLDDKIKAVSFGINKGDFHATTLNATETGLTMNVETSVGNGVLESQLFGRFNAANLLAVLAVLISCGLTLKDALERLSQVKPVAGRMERFRGTGYPLVVVDYAHTPDALEKVLMALHEHPHERLWCVFGCGGDRDRGKRAQMGEIAERLADHVVLTDDNPRNEDPANIIADIQSGMHTGTEVIHKRNEAIRNVISRATSGDIILFAGKGHEDYQQIGDERVPYSDRETVIAILGEAA